MAKWILARLRRSRFFPVGMVLAGWCVIVFAQARQADTQVRLPMVEATDLRVARITFGEGPSHMEIDAMVQDDQGFLWFGARNGWKRFDGYSIREFHCEPNDLNSLTGSSKTWGGNSTCGWKSVSASALASRGNCTIPCGQACTD